jgi:hypothetical protein
MVILCHRQARSGRPRRWNRRSRPNRKRPSAKGTFSMKRCAANPPPSTTDFALSEKWFTNHGQALATVGTVGSFLVALLVNWSAIREHQGLFVWWPVIAVPLAVYVAFRIGRSSRPTEAPKEQAPPTPTPEQSQNLRYPTSLYFACRNIHNGLTLMRIALPSLRRR